MNAYLSLFLIVSNSQNFRYLESFCLYFFNLLYTFFRVPDTIYFDIDDGLHEIFVNTQINDGTDIAELMSCFKQKEVNNPKFPETSAEVTRLKETEGGTTAVCEVMEKYEKIAATKAVKNANIEKIIRMLELKCSKEFISSIGYTEAEIFEAQKQMSQ